jgi:hypothetical protein
MIHDDRRARVFARAAPTDMRKSFDTLAALVTQELGRDPPCAYDRETSWLINFSEQ